MEAGSLKVSGETLNNEVAGLETEADDTTELADELIEVEEAAEAGRSGRRAGRLSGETRAAKRPSDEV